MEHPFDERFRPAGPRGPRLAAHPIISAVILADHGVGSLRACLDSLIAQSGGLDFEIVVVRDGSELEGRSELEAVHPSVRFIPVPSDAGLAQRRAAGMAAAHGDIVTFIEERRLASFQWMSRLPWSRERETSSQHTMGDSTRSTSRQSSTAGHESYSPPYASFSTGGSPDEHEPVA